MLDWLNEHATVIDLGIGLCTLLIWLVYAQLLYAGFRRQRHPSLIINRGRGPDPDAPCVVGNMSEEGVFVQYVVAELENAAGTITADVTDREIAPPGRRGHGVATDRRPEAGAPEVGHQGPLKPNHTFHLDTFRELLERLAGRDDDGILAGEGDERFAATRLTLRLIASYGPEHRPVGAERTFRVEALGDDLALVPETWHTRRLSTRRQRRALEREVEELYRREADNLRARALSTERPMRDGDRRPGG